MTDAAGVREANAQHKRSGGMNGSGATFNAPLSRNNSMNSGAEMLPPGWMKVWSKSKQKFYYYNAATGRSSWTIGGCN